MARPCFAIRWRDAVLSKHGPSDATTRLVLMGLCKHMNGDGSSCFPSTETIAEATSVSKRSVCTHLARAQAAGWIRVQSRKRVGQGWRRHEYIPLIPAERGETDSLPCGAEGGEACAEGGEPNAEGGEGRAPEGGEGGSLYHSNSYHPKDHTTHQGKCSEEDWEHAVAVMQAYNEVLDELPRCKAIHPKRVANILTAQELVTPTSKKLNEPRLDWWRRYFAYVRDNCPFLTGDAESGFIAEFDWLTTPENAIRVAEGKYVSRPKHR